MLATSASTAEPAAAVPAVRIQNRGTGGAVLATATAEPAVSTTTFPSSFATATAAQSSSTSSS